MLRYSCMVPTFLSGFTRMTLVGNTGSTRATRSRLTLIVLGAAGAEPRMASGSALRVRQRAIVAIADLCSRRHSRVLSMSRIRVQGKEQSSRPPVLPLQDAVVPTHLAPFPVPLQGRHLCCVRTQTFTPAAPLSCGRCLDGGREPLLASAIATLFTARTVIGQRYFGMMARQRANRRSFVRTEEGTLSS